MSLARWSCACLLVAGLTGVVRGQTAEEVEKKLVEAHSKIKSYTSKSKMTQSFDMGQGNKSNSEYGGTIEWKRAGDKQKFRTEMKGTTTQSAGGADTKTDISMVMVSDGDILHQLSDRMGQKTAVKLKPDASMTGDPKKMFEKLHADNTVKLLPEEKVDGTSTVVFEVVPKDPSTTPVAKTIMYYAKDTGINVKTMGKDKDGKDVFTNTITDIKLNTEIPDDRFVFKAPEGVQVMDMTGVKP